MNHNYYAILNLTKQRTNMKRLSDYIEEGLLSGQDRIISSGNKIVDDMHKLQYNFAFLSNLPWYNKSYIVGGMRGIYKKYFNKNVPTLKTNRHATLQTLYDHPEAIHTYNKLDPDNDYLATYLLQIDLDKIADDYDFIENKNDRIYLEKLLNDHLAKILNDNGKNNLKLCIESNFHGGKPRILTIALYSKNKDDFKPSKPRFASNELIKFNYTEGQYYPI